VCTDRGQQPALLLVGRAGLALVQQGQSPVVPGCEHLRGHTEAVWTHLHARLVSGLLELPWWFHQPFGRTCVTPRLPRAPPAPAGVAAQVLTWSLLGSSARPAALPTAPSPSLNKSASNNNTPATCPRAPPCSMALKKVDALRKSVQEVGKAYANRAANAGNKQVRAGTWAAAGAAGARGPWVWGPRWQGRMGMRV